MQLHVFCKVDINIVALSTKWSTGQKVLDYPFQFHFGLNTTYFKVLLVVHAQVLDTCN